MFILVNVEKILWKTETDWGKEKIQRIVSNKIFDFVKTLKKEQNIIKKNFTSKWEKVTLSVNICQFSITNKNKLHVKWVESRNIKPGTVWYQVWPWCHWLSLLDRKGLNYQQE